MSRLLPRDPNYVSEDWETCQEDKNSGYLLRHELAVFFHMHKRQLKKQEQLEKESKVCFNKIKKRMTDYSPIFFMHNFFNKNTISFLFINNKGRKYRHGKNPRQGRCRWCVFVIK